MSDSIYIIFEGKCRILFNLENACFTDSLSEEVKKKYDFVVLDYLQKGQIFGEYSAIDGVNEPFSVEVVSDHATVFRINRQALTRLFKEDLNTIVGEYRAQIRMKTNWLAFTTQNIQHRGEKQLKLEFVKQAKPESRPVSKPESRPEIYSSIEESKEREKPQSLTQTRKKRPFSRLKVKTHFRDTKRNLSDMANRLVAKRKEQEMHMIPKSSQRNLRITPSNKSSFRSLSFIFQDKSID